MSAGDWFELAIVLLLVMAVAVLGAAEVSITRTNRVRAYRFQEEERRGAGSLVKVAENPAPYLNVVLLLVLLATIGGTTIATSLAVRVFHGAGEIVATLAMTLILFVFAEVTPKTFAIQQTDRVALFLAPLIVGLGRLFGPLAGGLVKVANLIMPGKGLPQGPFITEHELRALAEVASDEDQIEEGEKELIHSIFEFGDTIVREVMVPRPDIIAIEADKTLRDVQALVLQHGYSRIPVFREDLDDVAGIVYAKDVLKALHQGKQDMPLSEIVREVHFVPESKKVADLLREMQREKFHIALVTDEYGSVVGLVTLEDLLEELVGEITDEYDTEEPELEQVADDVFRVDGKISIDEVNEVLDVDLPDEEWDTVGGLMLGLMGSIPQEGEHVAYQNLRFTAEQVNGRRISKVLITREEAPEEAAEGRAREEEARAE
jgi:CBS domain containing-hemolysin-like protein